MSWQAVTVWCAYHRQYELPRERTWPHRTIDAVWSYAPIIWLTVVVTAFLVFLFWIDQSTAGAHTLEEMEAWEQDWQERFNAIDPDELHPELIAPLIAERADWVDRHTWYYFPEDAPDQPESEPTRTTPRHTGMGGNVEQWRALVTAYFGADKADTALCLMSHESGGNPNAKNPRSSASGLFQLLAQWHDYYGIDPFNPEQNISAAARLQAELGWSQWSPYNRGLCR